jgi:uncharacterized protein (TIGR00369 family)
MPVPVEVEKSLPPPEAPSPPSVFDRLGRKPPAAELLGWHLLAFDKEGQWARVSFLARPEFANPTGFVQGGQLAAMLDEAMGTALIVATDAAFLSTTISMTADFIRPAPVGLLHGEGRVTSLGKSVAFLEARLATPEGKLVARATASCKLVPMDPSWISE